MIWRYITVPIEVITLIYQVNFHELIIVQALDMSNKLFKE